ncbi:TnsA-like heteromeric transposase endonuclease subunit [Leifsonia sp. C5G2]|uniref:TnsA-like heteromeric transposase endonuclease subunit n=1 Tax=Leifsonia sp. C5G2 TaxID=2735269 RepID=UPI0015844F7B|nr:TnsA-like heteromeric transposase endonuclease subunit [Leifsonia sp. C5G2]
MGKSHSWQALHAHNSFVSDNETSHSPLAEASATSSATATVEWCLDRRSDSTTSALAGPALLGEELYLAAPTRTAPRYPRQRNYTGYYYFSQISQHIWHESLLEAATLRRLDYEQDIVAIAAQPMTIRFSDATWHIPDYLAVHADGTQVLYDVKPESLMNDAVLHQFSKTRDVCATVGWGYAICNDLAPLVNRNLTWLANFKHRGYHPGVPAASKLLEFVAATSQHITIGEAARSMGFQTMAHARSSVYHLIWVGMLAIDLDKRINDNTIVKGGRHARS